MTLNPKVFFDKITKRKVRAASFAADSDCHGCIVTIPAAIAELVNVGIESESGLWSQVEFHQRFNEAK